MGIPMLKIRRQLGRLIFNMGIAIPGKTVFLIETAPMPSLCDIGLFIRDRKVTYHVTDGHETTNTTTDDSSHPQSYQ